MKTKHLIAGILTTIFICSSFVFVNGQQGDLSAVEIVKKAYDKMQGKSSMGEMSMTIVRPGWSRTVTMKSWSLGTDYTMIYITSPAREKGHVFLKRKTEMWNWVPAIDRMIKLPPSMMMQSWMGSDFTNDDLAKADSIVVDYNHIHIKDEKMDGEEVLVIQCDPKPKAAVVWGKIIIWIRKRGYVPLREGFYNEKGEMVKLLTFSDIRPVSGREVPMEMIMKNLKKDKHQTRIKYHILDFNPVIKKDIFSLGKLKRLGQ